MISRRLRGLSCVGAPRPTIVCDLRSVGRVDVGTVDLLARLELAARRAGCRLHLCNACAELRELVELLGLTDVLRLEAGGEPEEREEPLRVEEERQLGDATV